mgnify:CR=1 FL=1
MRQKIDRIDGVLIAYCRRCGAHVQESLGATLRTGYTETILCWNCGADNSVRPPLGWRLAYGLKNARKRRSVLGLLWWTRYAPWKCWMMPYEIKLRTQ